MCSFLIHILRRIVRRYRPVSITQVNLYRYTTPNYPNYQNSTGIHRRTSSNLHSGCPSLSHLRSYSDSPSIPFYPQCIQIVHWHALTIPDSLFTTILPPVAVAGRSFTRARGHQEEKRCQQRHSPQLLSHWCDRVWSVSVGIQKCWSKRFLKRKQVGIENRFYLCCMKRIPNLGTSSH